MNSGLGSGQFILIFLSPKQVHEGLLINRFHPPLLVFETPFMPIDDYIQLKIYNYILHPLSWLEPIIQYSSDHVT